MRVQVEYETGPHWYTFEVPAPAVVGDVFYDGGQAVVVRAVGSDYDGPVRTLDDRRESKP
jgi:hypothetical protein